MLVIPVSFRRRPLSPMTYSTFPVYRPFGTCYGVSIFLRDLGAAQITVCICLGNPGTMPEPSHTIPDRMLYTYASHGAWVSASPWEGDAGNTCDNLSNVSLKFVSGTLEGCHGSRSWVNDRISRSIRIRRP